MNSHTLAPISCLTLKDAAYENIRKAIVSGKLAPGTQVTISHLAEQMGVSLMPVRESLKKLEAQNLIKINKNRRITVTKYSAEELSELLEIRLHLESMAATKGSTNCTNETIAKLELLIEEMEHAKDIEDYFEKNRDFHLAIYQLANMSILSGIIHDLWLRVSPYLHILIAELSDFRTRATPYHVGMVRGLREKDAHKVNKYLKLDLKNAADVILAILRERK